MVLPPAFTSRRLALLGLVLFVIAVTFLQTSRHIETLPQSRLPGFTSVQDGEVDSAEPSESSPAPTAPIADIQKPEWWKNTFGNKGEPVESPHTALPPSSAPTPTFRSRPGYTSLSKEPPSQVQSKIFSVLDEWVPPTGVQQWPPYEWYGEADYDPNAWEGFEWNNDYYINNGVKSLASRTSFVTATPTPTPYLPYPQLNDPEWNAKYHGDYVPCIGPRGKPMNESLEDIMHAWPGVPDGFPDPALGDPDAAGIDIDHCFDRFHRFGPYGYGQEEKNVAHWQQPSSKPDWSYTPWGELQDKCVAANHERFAPEARTAVNITHGNTMPADHLKIPGHINSSDVAPSYRTRTAVLIRTWEGYNYKDNDLEAIRALIAELNLLSGGEYQVFLFVNIKDLSLNLFGNHEVYMDTLKANVPREFWDIAILWNERVMEKWYPRMGHWVVYWHQFMPVQWFSKLHPEFDFIWNWETDARYTGNHYHFLEQIAKFSRKAPRKYLWERNARFNIPAAHGTYEQFLNDTHTTVEEARSHANLKPVWGPAPYTDNMMEPVGPKPPRSMDEDNYEWGVGEEADLITLQPIWDPTSTQWTMRDKIWNFVPGVIPSFTGDRQMDEDFSHPDFYKIPRRAYINTMSRFSRRQLHAMHIENLNGRSMQSELWPATAALHHGLKAVFAPHPVWTDRKWPAWYMDAIFNADGGGRAARWSQEYDSVYAHDREHNFHGWSWYYDSAFPRVLYRRWLGWMANVGPKIQFPTNPLRRLGGWKFEQKGVKVVLVDDEKYEYDESEPPRSDGDGAFSEEGGDYGSDELVVGGKGRMCLPGMLLHPVKNVYKRAETLGDEDKGDY